MKAELLCTIERFPALKEKITLLFNNNEEFQSLCRDYFLCVKSLAQWEMSAEKDEMFLRQHKEFKIALENELQQFLDRQTKKMVP
jgi:hypothetical protein